MNKRITLIVLLVMGSFCFGEQPTTLPTTRPITSMDAIFDAIPREDLPLKVDPSLESLEKATRLARPLKGRVVQFHIKPTAVEKGDVGWRVLMENTEYIYADKQVWLSVDCFYPLSEEAVAIKFKVGEAATITAVINKVEFNRLKKQIRLVLSLNPLPDPAIGH